MGAVLAGPSARQHGATGLAWVTGGPGPFFFLLNTAYPAVRRSNAFSFSLFEPKKAVFGAVSFLFTVAASGLQHGKRPNKSFLFSFSSRLLPLLGTHLIALQDLSQAGPFRVFIISLLSSDTIGLDSKLSNRYLKNSYLGM